MKATSRPKPLPQRERRLLVRQMAYVTKAYAIEHFLFETPGGALDAMKKARFTSSIPLCGEHAVQLRDSMAAMLA